MEHMTTRIDYRQEFAHLPFSIKAVIHTVFDQTFKQRVCAADNDNVMFIWVKEGELELSLMQGFFLLHSNHFCYILPDEDYMLRGRTAGRFYAVAFDGPLAVAFLMAYRFPRLSVTQEAPPEELFEKLSLMLPEPDPNVQLRSIAVVAEIIACAGAAPENKDASLLERFKALVQNRYCDSALNINIICDYLGCHRTTLYRTVRQKMGRSPIHYLRSERCVHALAMLRGTKLPIVEIGKRCGIPDPIAFNQFIHYYVKMSPGEYRKINASSK
ncbi:MAG: helix-turn-helix transcriptional regulator [Lentisphaeria bacterium]|nr:MAG: helix-turn-helix transcriptional regulator [Lentisphaeria bacterium]